ncbi:MAG: DNA internalization-related competence protein ComEC/Rec2 [Acidaminococcales bacterium]|jgi:competence protein ComEC|nr:DNA internalization-related competence protein ComEC/Rec2 [Acidaminococcales bacterium]
MNPKKLFFVGGALFALAVYLAQAFAVPSYFAFGLSACGAAMALSGLFKNAAARFLCYGGSMLFFFASGLLIGTNANAPAPDSVFYLAGRTGVITGSVVPGTWRAGRAGYAAFLLQSASFHAQGATGAQSGNLRITLRRVPEGARLKAGDIVSIGGEIRPLSGFANPGGIDTVAYERRRDVYGRVSADYEDIAVAENETSLAARAEGWLGGLKDAAGKILPPSDRAIIFGMLFGGQEGIDGEIIQDFSTTGLIHILSVSGAHVAMIAGFVGWLLGRCRLNRKKAAPFVIAAIWFYALLSSFSIPVIRSAAMGTAVLVGRLFGRKADSGAILAFVLLLSLIYEPRWIFSISLQLSFLAAAGIIYIYPPLKAKLDVLPEMPAAALALTLSAQIATLPFLANYFYQISLVAFLANILILPLLEGCLVAAFFALPFLYILPPVGSLVFIAAGLLLGIALRLAEFIAAFPFAALSVPYLPPLLWSCYYLALLSAFDWLPGGFTKRGRLIICGGALCAVLIGFLWRSDTGGRLAVHFMDVGQGDAALVITPRKRAILIDAGGRGFSGGYDAGERVVLPYLKYYGLKELQLLILSHGHDDHAGGAAAVAKSLPVREIWLPAGQVSDDVERLLKNSAHSKKVVMAEGTATIIDDAKIKVIYAPDSLYAARKKTAETSAVIKLSYQGRDFLFTGDITAATEREIAPLAGQISVLKVAHHGSGASSDPLFIGTLNPELSVISVGGGNRYGHPSYETLERLSRQGCATLRTDFNGAVLVEVTNGALKWHTYKQNPEHF